MIGFRNTAKVGSKKMMSEKSQPKHKSTQELWQIGEGLVPKKISVAAWNVNGIRSVMRKGSLKEYISQYKPDFLCINETKIDLEKFALQRAQLEQYQGYSQYWNFCKISSGYSGVSIYAKHKPIQIIQDFPQQPELSQEGRVITLQYAHFYLMNVYKPNTGTKLERLSYRTQIYDSAFTQLADKLMKTKPVIICGDMNVAHHPIDLARPEANKGQSGFTIQERNAFSKLMELQLVDSYRHLHPTSQKYTWWSNRIKENRQKSPGWRIDYILVDKRLSLLSASIQDSVMGSDHCPISAEVQLPI